MLEQGEMEKVQGVAMHLEFVGKKLRLALELRIGESEAEQ
jgi:hypothetical protein